MMEQAVEKEGIIWSNRTQPKVQQDVRSKRAPPACLRPKVGERACGEASGKERGACVMMAWEGGRAWWEGVLASWLPAR